MYLRLYYYVTLLSTEYIAVQNETENRTYMELNEIFVLNVKDTNEKEQGSKSSDRQY